MYLSEQLVKKWQPVLEHPELPKVTDNYRKAVTAVILENQERAQKEDNAFLMFDCKSKYLELRQVQPHLFQKP